MERVSVRTASLAAALCATAPFPADAQTAPPADAQRIEPPRFAPEALLTAIRRYVVRVRVEGAQPDSGFGVVLARRGDEIVVATAGHVVVDDTGLSTGKITVVLEAASGQPIEAAASLLPGQEPIDRGALDLAFLRVKLAHTVPLMGALAAPKPPRSGEPVWVVAPVVGSPWSLDPGKVEDIGTAQDVGFTGGGVQTGSSGSPLVSMNGIVGLVRTTNSVISYAVSIANIRAQFIERYAQDYSWALPFAPLVPDRGWVRLARSDDATDFDPPFELMPSAAGVGAIPAPMGQWLPVSEGLYTIRAVQVGPQSQLHCEPWQVQIRAFVQRSVSVTCRVDLTGTWIGPRSTFRITALDIDSYAIREVDPTGREIAHGTGTMRRSVMIAAMESDMLGSWTATLSLSPEAMRGRRRYLNTGAQEDVTWTRAF